MKSSLKLAASAFALALACTAANAQTIVGRSVTTEPVETTVTQTPTTTIVTRRPIAQEPAPLVAPQFAAPVLAPATAPAAAFIDTAPETVDTFTTRQVVRRAEAERVARPMLTRQVAAERPRARRVSTTVQKRPIVHRGTRAAHKVTHRVAHTRVAPRLVLEPRERQIVYRTIVEREVVPRRPVIMAPSVGPAVVTTAPAIVAPPPTVFGPAVRPPVVAADETVMAGAIPVGSVLPANIPLYAIPENVAISVPAARTYSYAYLGGRAYLVDPASGTIVADVTQ